MVLKVAHKWNDLGLQLLLRPEALDIIKLDHPRDAKECCKCVFKQWLDTTTDATWNKLISALKSSDVQLDYLADQIENMLTVEVRFI